MCFNGITMRNIAREAAGDASLGWVAPRPGAAKKKFGPGVKDPCTLFPGLQQFQKTLMFLQRPLIVLKLHPYSF